MTSEHKPGGEEGNGQLGKCVFGSRNKGKGPDVALNLGCWMTRKEANYVAGVEWGRGGRKEVRDVAYQVGLPRPFSGFVFHSGKTGNGGFGAAE